MCVCVCVCVLSGCKCGCIMCTYYAHMSVCGCICVRIVVCMCCVSVYVYALCRCVICVHACVDLMCIRYAMWVCTRRYEHILAKALLTFLLLQVHVISAIDKLLTVMEHGHCIALSRECQS